MEANVEANAKAESDGALDAALDELYAAPFDSFVSLRGELSKRLRGSGDTSAARQVAQAAKPTRTTWALNQVARKHPDVIAAIVHAREAAATAQKAGDAQAIREGVRHYREAVANAVRTVRATLAADGVALSPAQARRLGETVQALSANESERGRLASGRLTRDVEVDELFAGVELGAEVRPPKERGPARGDKASRTSEAEGARAREVERLRAERERQEREHALEVRRARITGLEDAVDHARKAAADAEREARRAQYDSDKAGRALAELERKLALAREDLK